MTVLGCMSLVLVIMRWRNGYTSKIRNSMPFLLIIGEASKSTKQCHRKFLSHYKNIKLLLRLGLCVFY